MRDLGLLLLRLVTGPLLIGHGAQKLFGWFGGYGLKGTSGFMESVGLKPGGIWGFLAGFSEFSSGLLMTLGFLHPLGSVLAMGPMGMAMSKVHWGKPIWGAEGGGELPVTNMAVAATIVLTGPGKLSMDNLFGIRIPWPVAVLVGIATAAGIGIGVAGESLMASVPQSATPAQGTSPTTTSTSAGVSVE